MNSILAFLKSMFPKLGGELIEIVIGSNLTARLLEKAGIKSKKDGDVVIKDGGINNPTDEIAFALAIAKAKDSKEWKAGGKKVQNVLESLPEKQRANARICIGFLTNFSIVKKVPHKVTTKKKDGSTTTTETSREWTTDFSVEFLKYLATLDETSILQEFKVNGFLESPEDKIDRITIAINNATNSINKKPYRGFWRELIGF